MKPIHCYAEQFFFFEVFCFVHQPNTFKINNAVHFSHSQNCKVNYLKLQIWLSKLLQSIMFTWAFQLIYAHGGQCPSYVLSEVRLCASDPVQDCIKGEPLCNPSCGPRWLRLAFIIVCQKWTPINFAYCESDPSHLTAVESRNILA